MSEAHEDIGYTPAGNKSYLSKQQRSEASRDRELPKIFAELDESLQKPVDMQSNLDIVNDIENV